jgi:hypothetical protein
MHRTAWKRCPPWPDIPIDDSNTLGELVAEVGIKVGLPQAEKIPGRLALDAPPEGNGLTLPAQLAVALV